MCVLLFTKCFLIYSSTTFPGHRQGRCWFLSSYREVRYLGQGPCRQARLAGVQAQATLPHVLCLPILPLWMGQCVWHWFEFAGSPSSSDAGNGPECLLASGRAGCSASPAESAITGSFLWSIKHTLLTLERKQAIICKMTHSLKFGPISEAISSSCVVGRHKVGWVWPLLTVPHPVTSLWQVLGGQGLLLPWVLAHSREPSSKRFVFWICSSCDQV